MVPGRTVGEQGPVGIGRAGLAEHGDGLIHEGVRVGAVGLGDIATGIQEIGGFYFRLQIHIGHLAIFPGVTRLGQQQAAVWCAALKLHRALGCSRQVEGGVIPHAGVGFDGHVGVEGEHLAVDALLVRIDRNHLRDLNVFGRTVEASAEGVSHAFFLLQTREDTGPGRGETGESPQRGHPEQGDRQRSEQAIVRTWFHSIFLFLSFGFLFHSIRPRLPEPRGLTMNRGAVLCPVREIVDRGPLW
ncbi:hypothetical protein D3C79_525700 [compost metagenome]